MIRSKEEAKISGLFDPLAFCSTDADNGFYNIVDIYCNGKLCQVFEVCFHFHLDIISSHFICQNGNTADFACSFFIFPCGSVNDNITCFGICLIRYQVCCNKIVISLLLLCFFFFLADAVKET